MPEYKKKEMLSRFEKLVNKKKRELAEEYETRNKNEKENEKFLIGNKTKGEHDNDYDKNVNKKKKKDKYNNKKKDKKGENNNNTEEKKKFLNRKEFKIKKRLETYGITE